MCQSHFPTLWGIAVPHSILSSSLGVWFLAMASASPLAAAEFTIQLEDIVDTKAVMASVEPLYQLVARARIGGVLTSFRVQEGDQIAAGEKIGLVVDQKIALQMQALSLRMRSQQAIRDQARLDFERIQELQSRGVSTQTQFDQARTALDVANATLSAMTADYSVLEQQVNEGNILAPGSGRALSVPVSEGQVVLPGEIILSMAEERYILRLRLPERHAQILSQSDRVEIGARGIDFSDQSMRRQGKILKIYPQINGGLVQADVEVEGLGTYFVGERTRVFISTGQRKGIKIPHAALYTRAGVTFVRLVSGAEVVVQPGARSETSVEILSGLHVGDRVVMP
ncbi:MAG: efflux RND transporter periplasmic adaptor subunit [Alphaproteobacteria bacterium]|nr:efflux RND transporter periplasmic adaptor subunit [Alphaproteobacteria bacterium]